MFRAIWNFLTFWSRLSTKYNRIASDPELREKSICFGVESIVSSIFGAVIIALCTLGISALIGGSTLGIIFIVLLVIVAVVSLVQLIIRGLITMIYQRRLNKKPIGTSALLFWVWSVTASIAFPVCMLVKVL
ncbi:MAG: hypothetical protein HDT36_00565 [Clostridiales bacterium]|nr:hypothetical protein [Clostridiales bacterium]